METLTIRHPDDFHVHFRKGKRLRQVAPVSAAAFARAMVMPNTEPAITNGDEINAYRATIKKALRRAWFAMEPLMTFKITPQTTVEDVLSAKAAGAIAGKLYPDGVTTGSEGGVRDFEALYEVFETMLQRDLVLSIHGESPGVFCLDREKHFLETLERISGRFPDLRIVLEHLSSADAVTAVEQLPKKVAATITVHHLELTLDNLLGDKLNPHYFCKPLVKRPEDREALLKAALSGNPKFFLGTDSAPHAVSNKECACGCAGVYTAPVALPVLVEIFEKNNALDKLEPYVSEFGATFYDLPLNEGKITLIRKPWEVPDRYDDLVPYKAGETLSWQVQP